MLPLCDRVLLQLHARPMTARDISRALAADIATLSRVLRVLQEGGVLETGEGPRGAALWRLAPGVRVQYHPGHLEITGEASPPPGGEPANACRAVAAVGRRCRLQAGSEGLCFVHAPRGDTPVRA
jgi:DNA-binding transcriptional ArsR family regulator